MKSLLIFLLVIFISPLALAHFGMAIPSKNIISTKDKRDVDVTLSFSHPFEAVGMDLVKPNKVGVYHGGKYQDLLSKLEQVKVMGRDGWRFNSKIKRPGVYTFYMAPKPYWEPAEDCFIIHYTKTIISAFGDEGGWDSELGVETEIVPLVRPFGLYAGNSFQGVVKLNGKAVPYAEVEVEFYNKDGRLKASNDLMITQVVKADSRGVFTYTPPSPGWWGFAALNTSDKKIKHNGVEKNIELGAVLWAKFISWPK